MSCSRANLKFPNHKLKIISANMPFNKTILLKGIKEPRGSQIKYQALLLNLNIQSTCKMK